MRGSVDLGVILSIVGRVEQLEMPMNSTSHSPQLPNSVEFFKCILGPANQASLIRKINIFVNELRTESRLNATILMFGIHTFFFSSTCCFGTNNIGIRGKKRIIRAFS